MSQPAEAPASASPPPTSGRVPSRVILAYGPPVAGAATVFFFVQFYFLKFATDVLGIAPALVGTILALGRLWDAVTDPLVGSWSDRTRLRLGRRRPWMLASIPGIVATFTMLFAPPQTLTGAGLVVWVTVALFAFYTASTAWLVPHQALGAELTPDHHERSRVFGLRHAAFMAGMLLPFAGILVVDNAADPRSAAAELTGAVVLCVAILLAIPALLIREREDYRARAPRRPLRAFKDVFANRHARLLLFVQLIEMMGAGVLGVLSPFVLQYVIKRPELIVSLPAAFFVCSVASIPVWVRLSHRFGKRKVWRIAMVAYGCGFGAVAFVPAGSAWPVFALLVVAGVAGGCGGVMGPSILADVIDVDEHQTHERKEGAYSAAWGFATKSGNALVIFLSGWVLQLVGFEPNAEQTRTVDIALRALYGGLPFTMFLLGAWLFGRFRLDAAEHARIRAELDARAAAERSGRGAS